MDGSFDPSLVPRLPSHARVLSRKFTDPVFDFQGHYGFVTSITAPRFVNFTLLPAIDFFTPSFEFVSSDDEIQTPPGTKAPPVTAPDVSADAIDSHADPIDAQLDAYAKKKTMNIIVIPPEVVTLDTSSSAYS
jgi:hypothetical protein